MIISKRLLAIAAFLPIVCAGWSQVTRTADGYVFRLKLTKGQRLKFKIPFSISGLQSQPMHLHFGMTLTVLSVTREGEATVKVGKFDTGSTPVQGFSGKEGTFVVDRRGQAQSEGGTIAGFCIRYPLGAVPVGGHFIAPVASPAGSALSPTIQNTQATFTLVGFEGNGNRREARLTFKVAGNRAPSGTILVRLSDGVIDKYFTQFYATIPGGNANAPLMVAATVERQ